jgi:F-box interacting protein
MRALTGGRYLRKQYINSCNGIVLLAGEKKSKRPTCVLWNPAVADDDKEVAVPCPWKGFYRILGLGYGRRSKTYKLLLWRRWSTIIESEPPKKTYSKELLVYTLGGAQQEQPRSLMVFPAAAGMSGAIIPESLYLDGSIYILHNCRTLMVIAFDVDDETVTTIDIPGERDPDWPWHARSKLMEMSGRPCLSTNHGRHRVALWLLTVDPRWEQRCVIGNEADVSDGEDEGSVDRCLVVGVWDCGGVLAMFLDFRIGDCDRMCLYQVANEEMFVKGDLPRDFTPDSRAVFPFWEVSQPLSVGR